MLQPTVSSARRLEDDAGLGGRARPGLRVLIIGRTRLRPALASEPDFEVVVTRTPFEAIGEVADPFRQNGACEHVVVVGLDDGPSAWSGPGPELADLAEALRVADPAVRIVRVEDAAVGSAGGVAGAARDEPADAVLPESSTAEAAVRLIREVAGLTPSGSSGEGGEAPVPDTVVTEAGRAAVSRRGGAGETPERAEPPMPAGDRADDRADDRVIERSLERREPTPGAAGAEVAEAEHVGPADGPAVVSAAGSGVGSGVGSAVGPAIGEPAEAGAGSSASGVGAASDDTALIECVMRGRDVTELALRLVRRRLGREDVRLTPAVVVPVPGARAGDRPGDQAIDRSAAASAEAGEGGAGPAAPRGPTDVVVGGELIGRLEFEGSGSVPAEAARELARQASWLTGWLRLSRQHAELKRDAYSDPLTGAWNRRYFERFLGAAMARAREERLTVTLLVFDIDGFKLYNDKYGHAAGDEILTETVRALRSVIRPTDRVCRIGGDEFAVVFFEPQGPRETGSRPPESVYALTRRVQEQIRAKRFPKLGEGAPGHLTISGGLATFPWDGHDVATLLDRADQLAMRSKQTGKNAICFGPGASRACGGAERVSGD